MNTMKSLFITVPMILLISTESCANQEELSRGRSKRVTVWVVKPSMKYDLFSFMGILLGREFYVQNYPQQFSFWEERTTPEVSWALSRIDSIIGPKAPPGPRLCLLFSNTSAESIPELLEVLKDSEEMKRRLMASEYADPELWLQFQLLKTSLRIVLQFFKEMDFSQWWESEAKREIEENIPAIFDELNRYDVISDLETFVNEKAFKSDTIEMYVLKYVRPHGVRVAGQRFLTDLSYPNTVKLTNAYHEMLHPYVDGLVDSSLAKEFESLKQDPFLAETIERTDVSTGYKSFTSIFHEDLTMAAHIFVAEQRGLVTQAAEEQYGKLAGVYLKLRGSGYVVREYFRRHDDGIHVLGGVIYSFLERGLKKGDQTYGDFIRMLFEEGKLVPGKIRKEYENYMSE